MPVMTGALLIALVLAACAPSDRAPPPDAPIFLPEVLTLPHR